MSLFRSLFVGSLRGIWRLLPAGVRRGFWQRVGPMWQVVFFSTMLPPPAAAVPSEPDAPLVIAGLFSTANGIGESARATYRALVAAGLSPIPVDLSAQFASVDLDSGLPLQAMPEDKTGTIILQLNGPEILSALYKLKMRAGRSWFTIGYWAWELPGFPVGWERTFPFLSEVWAISDFTANALVKHAAAPPVRAFPLAVSPPAIIDRDRKQFGLPEDAFVFLTMADTMSSLERKNPFATIAAFKSAFGEDKAYQLVVKTRNLDRSNQARDDLVEAVAGARNIFIFDANLSNSERWGLLSASDAIVSLHRSEGFGFVLAEAMAIGKPVIATDWSGSRDFTDADTAYLVEYELVESDDRYNIYRNGASQWADVSADHARAQMIAVATDPLRRETVACAAKAKMADWADARRIGLQMSNRLSELSAVPAPVKG